MHAASAMMTNRCQESSAKAALLYAYTKHHDTIMHDDTKPLPAKIDEPSKCWLAGVCICCIAGKRLNRLRNAFMKSFKSLLPYASMDRTLCRSGWIIFHVYHQSEVASSGSADEVAMGDFEDEWFHCGMLYLSPLRPTYAKLILEHVEAGAHHPNTPERILVGFAYTEHTMLDAMDLLNSRKTFFLQLYKIEDS